MVVLPRNIGLACFVLVHRVEVIEIMSFLLRNRRVAFGGSIKSCTFVS